ncbi:MAG: alanine--tRNA ligase-related protein, partial [Blastocatellia bacterium]
MTTKLYWSEPRLRGFTARVVEVRELDGRKAVILDQTAFYPEGGGQPNDIGSINGVAVNHVSIDDNGRIIHCMEGAVPCAIGDEVTGEIDWSRRREMTQQHTGQHILS